jgi:hypothetical protein
MTARPGYPRFSGPFKTFSVSRSTNREKGTDDRLLVYSQGSRAKVVEYLWLKFLWDELTKQEFELFLILPETLNSEIKIAVLRSLLIQGKRVTRERLNRLEELLGLKSSSRIRYQGFKRLDVEIKQITRRLPRVPKFSGWVRSLSAVGSKRPGGPRFLEPLAIIENDYEEREFDWYTYLTVGELEILYIPVDLNHPEENLKLV